MKTVNGVIKELQELVEQDESLGEVPVYVIADHGQTYIQSGCVSVEETTEYSYYAETIEDEGLDEDDDDFPSHKVMKFVCIGD